MGRGAVERLPPFREALLAFDPLSVPPRRDAVLEVSTLGNRGRLRAVRGFRLREYLFSNLWFVPVMCVLAGMALSFGTIALERLSGGSLVPRSFSGDADSARSILMTVATSMVTLTGLVLTITMVVVQLAMGQFTPRVLRTILRDRPSQLAIGIFVATFAHAMVAMREVSGPTEGDEGHIPGLAIVVSYLLIVVCIVVLVLYVNHIGQSLRVASLIDSVGDETRALVDKLYPPDARPRDGSPQPPGGEPTQVIGAPKAGVLYRIDHDELVGYARGVDGTLVLVPQLGDFVSEGSAVLELYGGKGLDEDDVMGALAFGKERTLHQDLAYGFRMLVDVAARSVSPMMADPTTAVQAIDRVHDCLRQLVTRPFPDGFHHDEEGQLRLVERVMTWEGYVRLAVDELRTYGGQSLQLTRRLRAMLEDLLSVAGPGRRAPLRMQLQLLEAAVSRSFPDDRDRDAAVVGDQQGIGSGGDRVSAQAIPASPR
jgi:uncharacterized membrane protein